MRLLQVAPGLPGLYLFSLCLVFFPAWSLAQQDANQNASPAQIQDTPSSSVNKNSLPVYIEHAGTDQLGIRLAYSMREAVNRSGLFHLVQQNQRNLRVILRTRNEFADRQGLSSVYMVIWLFSTGEGVLSHYLESDAGFVTQGDIQAQAEFLVARTDGVASSYAYLFEN